MLQAQVLMKIHWQKQVILYINMSTIYEYAVSWFAQLDQIWLYDFGENSESLRKATGLTGKHDQTRLLDIEGRKLRQMQVLQMQIFYERI